MGNVVVSVVTNFNWVFGGFRRVVVVLFTLVVVVFRCVVHLLFVLAVVWVAVEDVSFVVEFSSSAGQDVSASTNHVLSESKLLAVKDEEVSVFVKAALASSALLLEPSNSMLLVRDLMVIVGDLLIVLLDSVVVIINAVIVVVDAAVKIIDVVVEVDEVLSQGFKGNHEFGFLLKSPLVLLLTPDLFPLVEVVNLVIEVASGNITMVIRFVMVFVVDWLWSVVVAMVVAMVIVRFRVVRVVAIRVVGAIVVVVAIIIMVIMVVVVGIIVVIMVVVVGIILVIMVVIHTIVMVAEVVVEVVIVVVLGGSSEGDEGREE